MICFAWHGFPQYAARGVGAFVRAVNEEVVVVATRPKVPVERMEELAGCKVVWIDEQDESPLRLTDLVGAVPRALFVSGWGFPSFNRFRDEVKGAGGRVIAMCDNDFRFSVREIIRALRFRLSVRKHYDGFWVPGKKGLELMRYYGASENKVRVGMYSADSSLFYSDTPLVRREKKMLYVGQLNERKNIVPFARAFLMANGATDWKLEICGCGPLKDSIPRDERILVHDFVQPDELAGIYRSARVFVLPSIEEHWGLVVHEGALSGCVLLLSDRVAAGADFLTPQNGRTFDPLSEDSMRQAIESVMSFSEEDFQRAQESSLHEARTISLDLFVENAKGFLSV